MAFIATGAIGFLWILCWLSLYHRPEQDAKVSAAELAYIQSDPPDQKTLPEKTVPWKTLLAPPPGVGDRYRQVLYRSDLVGLSVLDA